MALVLNGILAIIRGVAGLFETTMFKQLVYHPNESQILTTGMDKKITYWNVIASGL